MTGIGAKNKPRPRPSKEKARAAGRFKERVTKGKSCWLAPHEGECGGPLDAAHLIPAQLLRGHTAAMGEERWAIIYDPDLAIPLCRPAHHKLDYGSWSLGYEDLPERVKERAEELGLSWWIEKTYRKGER